MKCCIISESGELSSRMVVVAISRGYFTTATLPETRCNKIIADVLSYSRDEKLGRRRDLSRRLLARTSSKQAEIVLLQSEFTNDEFVLVLEQYYLPRPAGSLDYIDIKTRAPFNCTDVHDAINSNTSNFIQHLHQFFDISILQYRYKLYKV